MSAAASSPRRARGARHGFDATAPELGGLLEFMRLMWAVDHALQRSSKRMQASLGVTGSQRLVVRIVGKFPGIAAGHLAELLHLHPSTLTGVLKRLEARKLIRRRPDPHDARRYRFQLTPDGRRLNATLDGTVEAAVRRALRRLSKPQLRAARQALAVLASTLDPGPAD
jgi:DNA-binding MarR family transcriptional regulator